MTRPRKELISLADTPYYHIVSRCVRRTFLCGYDKETNTDYEHRKQWIVDRIRLLSSLFAVDICSYAIMSNHYHLVIKIAPSQTDELPKLAIAQRWTALYDGPLLIQRWLAGGPTSLAEKETINDIIVVWRERLSNLSWFMKCLNEPIARLANKEDLCTGHFWESRYKSQALRTDTALLSCMMYVDLNPIRANIAKTPEESDYTSIQERIKPTWRIPEAIDTEIKIKPLLIFRKEGSRPNDSEIPFGFTDYLELLDWTGRCVREDKRGAITKDTPAIMERLSINTQKLLNTSCNFETLYQKQFNRKIKRRRPG